MNDFFLYEPKENQDIPVSTYGSAAMKLIEMQKFPHWALFVYKDLKQSAQGEPPDLLAYIHSNAIILAPLINHGTVKGMLICEDRAFDQTIEMKSICGKSIKVRIPSLSGRYTAIEDMELDLIH